MIHWWSFLWLWQGFSECSLAGSLHTHILTALNTFPDSVKVETFSASAASSKSGPPMPITKLQGVVWLKSALDGLAHWAQVHGASRVTTLTANSAEAADASLQEKHTLSCQRNGDTVCTISCGTWIQVVFYPEQDNWADSTCVFYARYQGKWGGSGLLEAKPNSQFSVTLKASRNLSLYLHLVQTQTPTQCASKEYRLLLFTYQLFTWLYPFRFAHFFRLDICLQHFLR